MDRCRECGQESEHLDYLGWCDDCNYKLELYVMNEESADE